jgi:hypothetical protein
LRYTCHAKTPLADYFLVPSRSNAIRPNAWGISNTVESAYSRTSHCSASSVERAFDEGNDVTLRRAIAAGALQAKNFFERSKSQSNAKTMTHATK